MKYCAVIDTNVIVSALLSKHEDSATVQVLREIFGGNIIPLYHRAILSEYRAVLLREKFHLKAETVETVLNAIVQFGVEVFPRATGEILPDTEDLIFYEVAMEKRNDNAFLVTGNLRHFPERIFIVTPSEMLGILYGNIRR